jgi:hypothetical protein
MNPERLTIPLVLRLVKILGDFYLVPVFTVLYFILFLVYVPSKLSNLNI